MRDTWIPKVTDKQTRFFSHSERRGVRCCRCFELRLWHSSRVSWLFILFAPCVVVFCLCVFLFHELQSKQPWTPNSKCCVCQEGIDWHCGPWYAAETTATRRKILAAKPEKFSVEEFSHTPRKSPQDVRLLRARTTEQGNQIDKQSKQQSQKQKGIKTTNHARGNPRQCLVCRGRYCGHCPLVLQGEQNLFPSRNSSNVIFFLSTTAIISLNSSWLETLVSENLVCSFDLRMTRTRNPTFRRLVSTL